MITYPEPALPHIPESRLDPVVEENGVLLWVRRGSVTVDVGGRHPLVAQAGHAVWVPPALRHSAVLDADSVAVPVLVDVSDVPSSLTRACVVRIPAEWENWLLYRLARWFGFGTGGHLDCSNLIELLSEVAPVDRGDVLPPMPRSAGARSVISRLMRCPADPAGLAELAADAMMSPRSLQRRLSAETGSSLADWRTAVRIAAAAEYLVSGRDLGWIAHEVGYATVSGFVHAFARRTGVTPGRFAAEYRGVAADDPHERGLVHAATTRGAPPIPAVPSLTVVSPFDSILWVYRGTVSVTVADVRRRLAAGDVVWLSQGVPYSLDIDEDSILLPLGWESAARQATVEPPRVVRMPRALAPFLLHTVVANHFLLRPPDHDVRAFLECVRAPDRRLPTPVSPHLDRIVTAVIDNPADSRTLAEWAGDLSVDASTLRRDFADLMGEPFPRWRAKARMTEARSLMWQGHPPSVVARRLGYAHLPAFSKAFAASHGMPPREWLRREAVGQSRA